MKIRKIHKMVGVIFSTFFLLTAITGIGLLWRKDNVYGEQTEVLLKGIHNWEIAAKYIGVILASGLLFMTISGLIIAISTIKRKK